MLTRDEQETILNKVDRLVRNFWLRRNKVAKGEMRKTRCEELCQEERDELADYLKDAG
jgi:hypothetical protein